MAPLSMQLGKDNAQRILSTGRLSLGLPLHLPSCKCLAEPAASDPQQFEAFVEHPVRKMRNIQSEKPQRILAQPRRPIAAQKPQNFIWKSQTASCPCCLNELGIMKMQTTGQ
ncbi:hypothetical protein ACLKA6_010269 [Drosophila palustris]